MHVIYTVGPNVSGRRYENDISDRTTDPALLPAAYERTFEVASDLGLAAVALPAVSCGVFGYPLADAARIGTRAAVASNIDHVEFVLYSDDLYDIFANAAEDASGGPPTSQLGGQVPRHSEPPDVGPTQFGHAAGNGQRELQGRDLAAAAPQKKPRRSVSAVEGASSKSSASSSASRPSSCAQSAATSFPRGTQRKRCFCCDAIIWRTSKAHPFSPDRCISQASLLSDIDPATSGLARFAAPVVNKVTTSTPQTGMHK